MFQTWWDLNRQNVRKLVDTAMGVLGGYGAAYGEWGMIAAAALVLVVNYLWFWFDNRNKVTAAGLAEAGKSYLALEVKEVVATAEKKSR